MRKIVLLLVCAVMPLAAWSQDAAKVTLSGPPAVQAHALGASLEVPTLDGKAEIRVPPGIASGQRLRLKGQGLNVRGDGRGDHFVRLKIVVPKQLTEAEQKLFEELAKVSRFNPRNGAS